MTISAPNLSHHVGRASFALGCAGLLPQIAAVGLILVGRHDRTDLAPLVALAGYALAITYGSLILSFLGGIWWGFAMRRVGGQAALAAAAVVPSLVALALVLSTIGLMPGVSPWPAVLLGCAILLTLPVDRHLVQTEEAPANWMALRLPLSAGLGALTIAAGVLVGAW